MRDLIPLLGPISATLAYAAGLRRFLGDRLDHAEARCMIERLLAERERSFLTLLEHGVYGQPASPYRRLLHHAGIELGDVRRLVGDFGLEGALSRLYDEGVNVSLAEYKGRRPIRRGGLEFLVSQRDFDNPLAGGRHELRTSGSRGAPTRVASDFRFLAHEAAYASLILQAYGTLDRPMAIWRAERTHTYYAKIGKRTDRWFSLRGFTWSAEGLREAMLTTTLLLTYRLAGQRLPLPRFVSRERVVEVARWLAEMRAAGTPAMLLSNASPAVRVCLAAREHGLDISGSVFQTSGEPLTPAKYELIKCAGCRATNIYGMVEVPYLAASCAASDDPTDLHLFSEKVATIQRERGVRAGTTIRELIYTSTFPSSPKLMLNAGSGDYGTLLQRDCGCLFGKTGFSTHLMEPHSHEKLTSEGVTFMGSDLHRLLEEVLPRRFGGSPMDYQLVEEEENGLPRVSIVVAPRVGEIDESAVVQTILQTLEATAQGGSLMADEWRQSTTLRVARREPHETRSSKVLPLHVLRP